MGAGEVGGVPQGGCVGVGGGVEAGAEEEGAPAMAQGAEFVVVGDCHGRGGKCAQGSGGKECAAGPVGGHSRFFPHPAPLPNRGSAPDPGRRPSPPPPKGPIRQAP
ncbi:hypothetical protein GCM10020000_23480 [Streptomyces olivoverticillatus]